MNRFVLGVLGMWNWWKWFMIVKKYFIIFC